MANHSHLYNVNFHCHVIPSHYWALSSDTSKYKIYFSTHSNLEFLNADLQISEGIWQNILMPEKQPHYADQMMWEFWSKFMENYNMYNLKKMGVFLSGATLNSIVWNLCIINGSVVLCYCCCMSSPCCCG